VCWPCCSRGEVTSGQGAGGDFRRTCGRRSVRGYSQRGPAERSRHPRERCSPSRVPIAGATSMHELRLTPESSGSSGLSPVVEVLAWRDGEP
jgi:hypothetical protein